MLAWLRRQSHYGGNDGDGGGSSHSDGYVMWRVGHTVNISKGYCKEQRENGGHRSLVDLPFFFGSAWWRLRQSQESTSQDHVCSSPPAMSAEELRITVTAVFVPSLLALPLSRIYRMAGNFGGKIFWRIAENMSFGGIYFGG